LLISDGFAWIATAYGLHRYGGHKFKLFTKKEQGVFTQNVSKRSFYGNLDSKINTF
jgi:hypothetical protein